MKFFNRLLRSKKLLLVNLSLVSFLVGSFMTVIISYGCNDGTGNVFGKTSNTLVQKDSSALGSARAVQRAFRNVSKSIGKAVVSINAYRQTVSFSRMNDPFFRFFFGGPRAPRRRNARVLGSGFMFNKKGYLLTNYHVVKNATKIRVVFSDGREFKAKLVGSDKETDIAVLKIKPKGEMPVVPLGDSDKITVGDWAIAIGNPFGLAGTFTVGVVSAKSRGDKVGRAYQNFIQTDAAINPGNSGGPLVNIEGQVVGINTMIYTKTGGSLGIGFAVPINVAKGIVRSLISKGHYERGYLGIYPGPINDDLRKALKLKKNSGIIINSVVEKSPAAKAGMKEGDVILKIGKKKITSVPQLMRVVANIPVGESVYVTLQRKGRIRRVRLKIGKRPSEDRLSKDDKNKKAVDWLGLKVGSVHELSSYQLRRFGIRGNARGVVIQSTSGQSGDSELQAGDLIVSINYISVTGLSSYNRFVRKYGKRDSFIFKVKRQGRTLFIAVNR